MENKQQRPLFLGFSSQKGGVGKSTLAEIVSSILYYEQGINLFVMDCDLSQDSFYKLREREKSVVQESEELSMSMEEYFHYLGKKAYRIYKSSPKEAVRIARNKIDTINNETYQLVVFDFPGHAGTTELMELSLQMDYILSPLEADIQSLVSCMAYAKTITDIGVSMSDSRIRDIILFWNKVDRRVRNVIIDEYTKLIQGHELTLLPGYVYATHRFSHELSTYGLRGVFRSTSPIIPQIPSVSSSENSEQSNNNFAPQNSEKEEEMKEDNEMDVDFEMERVDEDEIVREELNLSIESTSGEAEISEQSVLARDLVRLQKWAKNSEEANEEEVKETVLQLQDSDLLDKYKENIAKMLGEQALLLEKIRKAEEKEEQSAQPAMLSSQNPTPPVSGISDTAVGDADDKPLSYYL